ncbi:MAG: TatD family hydrolase [Candidatus Omnitrophota bacterium]
MFIDTHCHLDFPDFDNDVNDVIERSRKEGIDFIINVGSSIKNSQNSLDLAKRYDSIYASVGIHPHEAKKFNQEAFEVIKNLAKEPKVIAIGEIGLDYYRNLSPKIQQQNVFIKLLDFAIQKQLPVILHNREASEDLLKILNQFKKPIKGVVHCFSENRIILEEFLSLGLHISFTCNITYKKAQNLRDLIQFVPLGKLLLETDAPFLPPEGLRGKRNEPIYVKKLAKVLAELKNVSIEEIANVTTNNAKELFKLT